MPLSVPRAPVRRSMQPPMLCGVDQAVLLEQPEQWSWEIKWDGFRAQLSTLAPALWSRRGRSLVAAFPEVVDAAVAALGGRDVVLDCELVVLDGAARPDFAALSTRARCRASADVRRAASVAPALLVAFDLLVLDEQDVRTLPWHLRRAHLDGLGLSAGVMAGAAGLVAPPAYDDGPTLLSATRDLGLEGVVAKQRQAPYAAGRTRHWIKVKHPYARDLVNAGRWRAS